MKRFLKGSLSIVLAITIIFSSAYVGLSQIDFGGLFTIKAEAATSGTCGDNLMWTLDDNGTLTISGTGDMTDYLSSSSAPWYSSRTSIETIIINSGVTRIGDYAFCYCTNLTSITIPDSVISIGYQAFYSSRNLTSTTVDSANENYSSVDGVLFNKAKTELIQYPIGKTNTSYIIPDSVTSIGDYAFYYCTSLTSIKIPESVTSIGDYAFYKCTNLKSITIPDSVTSIGDAAFHDTGYYNNSSNWENKVLYIGNHFIAVKWGISGGCSIKDGTKTIATYAFSGGYELTSITIPNSVTSIGDLAFDGCTNLTSITIPDSVTSIGFHAFLDCRNLSAVYISNLASWCNISFNSSQSNPLYSAENLYLNGELLTELVIPDGVTSIGMYAFYNCTSITSVITEGVTSIGYSAFYNCKSLTSITIPESVTSIGDYAFRDCINLTSITIPDSVTSIGDYAFYNTGYKNDESNWENGVLYINNHIISAKISLSGEYVIKSGTKCIASYVFCNCTSLTSIVIPDSVTSIGNYAFEDCTRLTSITIPDGVKSIGNHAFDGCTNLTSITIPDSVTSIGYYAFYNCNSLVYVFFKGTQEEWTTINFGEDNSSLVKAKIHYESIDHTVFDWIIDKEATCTIDGIKHKECTVCGFVVENAAIEPTGHIYSDWIIDKEATCTSDGIKHKECTVCGVVVENAAIEPTGHITGDWVIEANATCTGVGVKFKKCISCGVIIDFSTILATGHTYSDWIIDKNATCTESGSKYKVCTVCGESLESETIHASGHNYSLEWTVDKESTCTEDGSKSRHCTVCGDKADITTIEAIGHNLKSNITQQPTCTDWGAALTYCTKCDYEVGENISPTGHVESDWITDRKATCSRVGSKHTECENCGETITTAEIPLRAHVESDWITIRKATCTRTGVKQLECEVCFEVLETQTIPMKDHTEGEWIIDNEATVDREGKKHKECEVCEEILGTAEIPQLKCSKPVLKKVYNANSYVKVTWGTVKGADLYRVYRKTGTGDYEYIGSTTKKYFNDKEAGAGKTCRYIVKAKNEAGYSDASASIAIKHIDEPTLKSIENSANGVLIKWDKVTGAEKYNVYRKVSGGEYKYIGATSNTYYTDKTAKSGTKYYYAIRGKRDTSVSSQSASLSKYYLADPTLNTPTSTTSGIKLSWTKVTGAEGYMVYRKTGSGSYTKLATVKGSTKVTYTDSSAQKGKKYTYKIKAYKSKTYSAYSNTKSITDKY